VGICRGEYHSCFIFTLYTFASDLKSLTFPIYRVTILCVASITWFTQNIRLVDERSHTLEMSDVERTNELAANSLCQHEVVRLTSFCQWMWDARPIHDILHPKHIWQHVMEDCFQVLCLSPTYELAIQTGEVAAKMAQFCPDIKIRFAVRGEESKWITSAWSHLFIFAEFRIYVSSVPRNIPVGSSKSKLCLYFFSGLGELSERLLYCWCHL